MRHHACPPLAERVDVDHGNGEQCAWCPRRELNSHWTLRTGQFYPLNYRDISKLLVGVRGIEPRASQSRTERSTDEPHPDLSRLILLPFTLKYNAGSTPGVDSAINLSGKLGKRRKNILQRLRQ